jgi:hypothetical protein
MERQQASGVSGAKRAWQGRRHGTKGLETCSSLVALLFRPSNFNRDLLGRRKTGGINEGSIDGVDEMSNGKASITADLAGWEMR